jgi:hypothetical protein
LLHSALHLVAVLVLALQEELEQEPPLQVDLAALVEVESPALFNL